MYFYYFIMAAGLKHTIKWFNPIIITAMQISQMIVGVTVTLGGFYYYTTDPTCRIEAENNTAAFVMYGSYLFLFLQFFIGRYITSSKKTIDNTFSTQQQPIKTKSL
jgi:elongation of very long chain fatty acids protein 6